MWVIILQGWKEKPSKILQNSTNSLHPEGKRSLRLEGCWQTTSLETPPTAALGTNGKKDTLSFVLNNLYFRLN